MATFISKNPEQTRQLGAEWAQLARPGWVIGLSGDLGAGKTQIVIGLAQGLGVTERITSPTFTLVHEYKTGRLPLFHLDLYRLETPEQILGAGLEEYLAQPVGVAVVEWADRWFGDTLHKVGRAAPRAPFAPTAVGAERSALPPPNASLLPAMFRAVRIEIVNEAERRISYEDFGA